MLDNVICFSTGLFPALRTSLITLGFVFFFSLQLQEPLVMRAKSLWLSQTLCDPMEPARLLCPWNSPGKNTEAGCHFLLQGIFPTQGSNAHLLYWQVGFFTAEPP